MVAILLIPPRLTVFSCYLTLHKNNRIKLLPGLDVKLRKVNVHFATALLFLVFWLRNEVTSRFYIVHSQILFKRQECWKWPFRG